MPLSHAVIAASIAFLASSVAAGPVVYVDEHLSTGADNGTSWADAFRGRLGLKHALESPSVIGAEVWVAVGVYAPGGHAAPPSTSFLIPSGTALLGGFAGGESSAAQRDPLANPTILSGDLLEDDGGGPFDHTIENSWHVVRIAGANADTIVDGFTIRDGYADNGQAQSDIQGAGMLIEGGSPMIRRCVFLDSRAWEGGGMAVLGMGEPVIEDCLFTQNNSGSSGAGIYLDVGCDATIKGCGFVENIGSKGVGVYTMLASPVIEDCLFLRNTSPISAPSGGGIHVNGGAPMIQRCEFLQNESQGGGGITVRDAQPVISRCRFVGNVGTGDGGDEVVIFSSDVLVTNCEFIGTGDTTELDPSGILAIVSGGTGLSRFVNCTFANNGHSSGSAGPFSGHSALVLFTQGMLKFENCVIWGNWSVFGSGNGIEAAIDPCNGCGGNLPVFDRCVIQGWDGSFPGTGTIALDPMLLDADGADGVRGTEDDDVSLSAGSPCIDAGISAALPAGTTLDVAGLPRFRDDPMTIDTGTGPPPIVDLGAHEFQPPPCAGDANADGAVDFGDITHILAHWGKPFGFADITQTLAAWGGC